MNRRRFLASCAAGAGAAALSLPFQLGRAGASGEYPTRFVGLMTPNGTRAEDWIAGGGERDFEFGPILQALEPYREKLLVLQGIDMRSTYKGQGSAHQKGAGSLLTAQPLLEGDFAGGGNTMSGWAAGQSIDQRIAEEIGGETRIGSLELGVVVRGSNNRHRIAYSGREQPIAPENDPWAVFDRVFEGMGVDPELRRRARAQRQSVIDLVRGDLTDLEGRLGTSERQALGAHLESLRDVERRLDASAAACAVPELPGRPGGDAPHLDRDRFREMAELQMDMMSLALACDATRVGTILFSGATSGQTFPWLGINENHHSISHAGNSNRDAQDKLRRINQWYAEQVASFLARLDAVPEGDGTLLDHTVVFWGNELGRGNSHTRNDMSFVVAGGTDYYNSGRFLTYDGTVPHNGLLVSFGRACGLDIDNFGDRDFHQGELSGLT